jgi:hypothetical protein
MGGTLADIGASREAAKATAKIEADTVSDVFIQSAVAMLFSDLVPLKEARLVGPVVPFKDPDIHNRPTYKQEMTFQFRDGDAIVELPFRFSYEGTAKGGVLDFRISTSYEIMKDYKAEVWGRVTIKKGLLGSSKISAEFHRDPDEWADLAIRAFAHEAELARAAA